jgi:type VI secretion system protein VasD
MAFLCISGFVFCASAYGQTVTVQIQASASINAKAKQKGNPTQLVIYQLANNQVFNSAKFFSLLDSPRKVLRNNLITSKTLIIVPSSRKTIKVKLASDTRYLGFLIGYENYQKVVWKRVVGVNRIIDDKVRLSLTQKGLRLLATPVLFKPSNNHFYIEGSLGFAGQYSSPDTTFTYVAGNNVKLVTTSSKAGMQFGLGGGYQIKPQARWLQILGVNSLSVGGNFYSISGLDSKGNGINRYDIKPKHTYDYTNKISSKRFMLTGKVNFFPNLFFHPYLGAGLGMALNTDYFSRNNLGVSKTTSLEPKTYSNFAYQWSLGVDVPVTKNLLASVGYQFVNVGQARVREFSEGTRKPLVDPINFSVEFSQVTLGVKYLF